MAVVAALLFLISCAIAVAVAPDKLLALNHAVLLVSGLFMAWVLAMAARLVARLFRFLNRPIRAASRVGRGRSARGARDRMS